MQPHPLSSSVNESTINLNPLSLSQSNLRNPFIPQDGQGYGKSMNWHYLSISIAKKNKEKCDHFDNINKVLIIMSPVEEGLGKKIKFKVTCALCDQKFPLTSEKLTENFIKFYGL